MIRRAASRGSLTRLWYLAMPKPAIENPVNTPIA